MNLEFRQLSDLINFFVKYFNFFSLMKISFLSIFHQLFDYLNFSFFGWYWFLYLLSCHFSLLMEYNDFRFKFISEYCLCIKVIMSYWNNFLYYTRQYSFVYTKGERCYSFNFKNSILLNIHCLNLFMFFYNMSLF